MEKTKDKMSSENIDHQDGGKHPNEKREGRGFN